MRILLILACLMVLTGCHKKKAPAHPSILTNAELLHNNTDQLTKVIIYDVFNPPVASRIYAYTALASYEAIRFDQPGSRSIAAQLNDFGPMPEPEKHAPHNYLLAATKAFFTVAEKLTFSRDTLARYQQQVYADFRSLLDEATYERSLQFGAAVGKKVLERAAADNYKETRGMAKFIGSGEAGRWRPTPPDYLDGAEPHWGKMRPLSVSAPDQYRCPPPLPYSTDTASPFYRTAYEVYTIGKNLTEEQKTIARYWDDNPFVLEHAGHLMYGNKKITPVGHWVGITTIACRMKNKNAVETARIYTLMAAAVFDTFIACWSEKYRSNVVRPVTVIHERIDRNWQPLLQTPPFPEHSSGHSGISAAAATVLTRHFGDNFAFEDTSDLEYIGMKRSFRSFLQAAQEASISRVYGGIHYRTGIDAGAVQGTRIGNHINTTIRL